MVLLDSGQIGASQGLGGPARLGKARGVSGPGWSRSPGWLVAAGIVIDEPLMTRTTTSAATDDRRNMAAHGRPSPPEKATTVDAGDAGSNGFVQHGGGCSEERRLRGYMSVPRLYKVIRLYLTHARELTRMVI